MTDMIRKLMPVEVKEVGDRTLEMAGSTEDKDRMGDIIRASGWKTKSFKKNPVFMWVHDYSLPPIGRANKVWVDKETQKLMFNIEFASTEIYEFADTIYKLYKGGFLHATSVGFIPLDWEGKNEENQYPEREGNVFTSQELLELSAVPVPANANALVSAREQGLITVKEFDAFHLALGGATPEGTVTKPEETENYYRIPVKGEAGKHEGHRIRTIDIDKKKGIKALYCGECKKVITYLFDKEKWDSMKDCQEWVDEHSKAVDRIVGSTLNEPESLDIEFLLYTPPLPRAISQAVLGDELDFIIETIEEVGINNEQMPAALNLVNKILQRTTGNDIPDDILSKVGAVLNRKNKERLQEIRQLAQEVIDSATTEEEGDNHLETLRLIDDPAQRARDIAEVAQIVVAKLKGKRIR